MRISDWSSDVCSSDLAKVAKEYAVYFKAHPSGPGGGYLVDHTRMAYLMSPEGKPLALLPVEGPPQPIVDEIERRSEERRVGKECVVRVDLGGCRIIKKKTT